MVTGSCNCGAVSFEVDRPVSDVYVCHCSICRRFTGSSGIAVVVVPKDSFRWTGGQENIRTWVKPGHDWQGWFCHTCGSPLPGGDGNSTVFIPAGLITEGGEDLQVRHHIWVDSKAAWDDIGDGGERHSEGLDG